ncbi:neuronal acetylcholine receptor subunit alpha-2-like [Mercenaria mercenaria]|uniref:neuronal acetylcholine receptor subunit alpha-2-like n=1 Tax=Mercenaria mercenaria TaxID=6596 RepID=UPI00234E437C|nr:neuronal acetylcholine receptor subunit alpha-2-like [Mercenaria mercenaria]
MAKEYLIVLLLVCVISVGGQTIDDASLLHDTLMSGYNKYVRPSVDQSKPVVVNLTFELVSIRELDEIMGKLSIVGMLWLFWEEPRMTWNPFAYNQTFTARLPMKEVWKPDLVIAHPVDSTKAVGFDHHWYPVRYYYNGVAIWTPGDVMTTTCNIDVTYYPFDTQTCEVTFIPWGSLVSELYLYAAQEMVSRRFFTENGEWALDKATTNTGLIDGKYPTYIVKLELRRRPTFVIVNVILPILFMGLLNVLVFFLPASSGERVSFAMTVLLALAVFLTLVGDNMPKTSQPMSTICYFLLTNLVLSSLIMVVTIFNLNLYHRDDNLVVPEWLANVVRLLKCKRLPRRTKVENLKKAEDENKKGTLENVETDKKEKLETVDAVRWALPAYEDRITWREVSKVIDIVFGGAAVLWLLITAAAFFIMVATQNVPGARK